MFPKKIGKQRRDVIKIQQLIHLNSNAMKTISGSSIVIVGRNNCILSLITEIQFILVNVWEYMVRHNAR